MLMKLQLDYINDGYVVLEVNANKNVLHFVTADEMSRGEGTDDLQAENGSKDDARKFLRSLSTNTNMARYYFDPHKESNVTKLNKARVERCYGINWKI